MKDRYLYFNFDGRSSAYFNCWYKNEGEDISFPSYPDFSDETSTPLYQNSTYYMGTSIKNKEFTLNCVCEDITLRRYRELLLWLNIEKIGTFALDFIPDFHYKVKVSKISNTTFLPTSEDKIKFHCMFTVSFRTLDDNAAISNYRYHFDLFKPLDISTNINMDFDYRVPVYDKPNWLSNTIRIINTKPYECYADFKFNNVNNLKLEVKSDYYTVGTKPLLDYPLGKNMNLLFQSKHGFMLNADTNELIEREFMDEPEKQRQFINTGAFRIAPSSIKQKEFELLQAIAVEDKHILLTFKLPYDSWTFMGENAQYDILNKNKSIGERENTNFKAVHIQPNNYDDFLLYNEGGYNDLKYYVENQISFFSYIYNVNNDELEVLIINPLNLNETLSVFKTFLTKKLLISVTNYTEIKYATSSDIDTVPSGDISFNLRTVA